jgi:hypothetical protein
MSPSHNNHTSYVAVAGQPVTNHLHTHVTVAGQHPANHPRTAMSPSQGNTQHLATHLRTLMSPSQGNNFETTCALSCRRRSNIFQTTCAHRSQIPVQTSARRRKKVRSVEYSTEGPTCSKYIAARQPTRPHPTPVKARGRAQLSTASSQARTVPRRPE